MGVAEDYLKLRTKRAKKDEDQKKTGAGTASGGSTRDRAQALDAPVAGSQNSRTETQNVGAEYLKLREERGSGPPRLSLPEIPAAFSAAKKVQPNTAQSTEPSGLSLPELPPAVGESTKPASGLNAPIAGSTVPAWAQQMADRYKPVENAPKSPVAEMEARKRAQAQQRDRPSASDWASLAKDTALAGVGQVSKAAASLFSTAEQAVTRPMGWVLGNPDLYKDFPFYKLNQGADRNMEILQSNLQASAAETGKAGELIAQFGPATIAALPQAALAYLTAGQSLAAQASTAGLQAASTAAQLTGGAAVANTVLNAAKDMAVSPSFQYSFLNTVGGDFEQALADGADAPTAYAYAALTSLANAVVEVGGGIDTLPEELAGKNRKQLLEWVKSMLDEGKEEVIQGAISQLMQNGIYQKGNPLFSTGNEDAVINPGRMAGDFAGGAVVGGVLGGGQMLAQKAINRSMARSFQDEVRSQLEGGEAEAASPGQPLTPEAAMAQAAPEPKETGLNKGAGTAVSPVMDSAILQQESAVNNDTTSTVEKPGFSAEGANLSKTDRKTLDRLGKITGSNIQIVSREELTRITGREDANGVQIGGQIYLSEAADRPFMEVAKHEMTHRLQDTAPKAYGAFRDYVAGVYREGGTLESYIEGMIRSREQAGLQLTEEQALDEIAADYAGELMLDQDAVRRLAGEDRGLLERMLDGLREVIRKIKSALGIGQNGTDAQVKELEEAARLWQNALEESLAAIRAGQEAEAGDARYSFGGRNAQQADSAGLARAEDMERQGRDAETIRRETGWFRGMDGQWRFEIDDSGMKYAWRGDLGFRERNAAYDRYRSLNDRAEQSMLGLSDQDLTDAEWQELRTLQETWGRTFRQAGRISGDALPTSRLSDYVRHEELYQNYPQLREAGLRFAELDGTENGQYNPKTNVITISESLRNAPEDTIIHEVQHAIQEAEGFSKGSNPAYWSKQRDEIADTLEGARENLRMWLEDIGYSGYTRASMGEVTAGQKTMEQHWKDLQSYKDQSRYGDQIRACEAEIQNYQEQYDSITNGMTPTEQYWNTAGEIEARDAEHRRTMTAEQRRQTAPDLGDENTVFAGGSDHSASIGYDQDNRPFDDSATPPSRGRAELNRAQALDAPVARLYVEEDILKGVPEKDWVRTVKDNLRKKFPNGVAVGNSQIDITRKSRNELTHSRYTKMLERSAPDIFADKLRATDNTGEILLASRNYVNEGTGHSRTDDIQDFARGAVQLRIGKNDYTADVVVGTKQDGSMLLYDIVNLQRTMINERSKPPVQGLQPEDSYRQNGLASVNSIPQSGQEVKGLELPGLETDTRDSTGAAAGRPQGSTDSATGTSSPRAELNRAQPLDAAISTITGAAQATMESDSPEPLKLGEAFEDGDSSRNSMEGDAALKKEVERLRRQNQRLKEQTKRTNIPRRNREAVAGQAKDLLRTYSSQLDAADVTERLQTLWDHQAAKHGAPWERDKAPSWDEIRAEARALAQDILESSESQVNEMFDDYRELRKELRTTKLSISPEYRADLESAGGYNDLRKQYFGKLRLGSDGPGVDQVYDDLASRYPELFPDDIIHPADQLLRITDVIDELEPVVGNPYEAEMDRAAEYLAGDLIERFYDTPQKTPTFADKQAKKLAEQRKKDREEFQARLYRQRRETDQRIKRVQEKNKEANRKRMEKQTATQRRETIRRHANRLGKMLLRPTDKQHIPEELRGAVLKFVQSLNMESGYSKDLAGNRIQAQEGEQMGLPTKRSEAARELQEQYKALAEKGGFTIDPDMDGYLDELAGMKDTPLSKLSKPELDTVWKVMRVVEHCITTSNELLGQSRYATVSEIAERLREQNGGRKDRKNLVGMAGTIDQLLNMDMLTPETYFHKMGEAGETIFKQMRSAADQQTTVLKEGVERARTLMEESGVDLRKAEKETHTFSVSGGELTLSTAQVMELYVLSKREQAMEHIYLGGLKPKGARTGPTGIVEAGRAAPVRVTPSDVAEILETLTPEQKKLADGLQAYLSGDLARHGNDASTTVYGYEKFKEENYWPIKVDRNQTKSDVKQEAESKTVAGYGMTKAVKPNASNAVVLRGILDSYTDHLNQMSTYSGWLATSEDVNRIHNYRFTDGKGRPDGTVKTLLEQVYGKNGNSYLDKLMSDIAMGTKAGAEPSLADRGLNQFKAAKVGGNLRVILQQPTAIIRAASMLDPKYFLTARNPMKGWETAKEWSPIAQWKDWGYFELDTGRSLKEMIAGESSKLEAVKNKLMEPAGMADSVAWGHLWNAVEAETADRHPELKRGSEDFYRAAAERFGEIIDRTQVVDSVLHRTQIMRSSNSLTRMSTSFMSEPSKIFNMVARDLYDIQAAKSGKERAEAGKNLARSATALIASFAVNAVAQSLPDLWRNKDRDKELGEKFTDAYMSNFLENFDPVGYVPYLKDLESIAQGFSVDRSDLEGYSDVVNALGQMKKAWDGESKQSVAAAALELACRGGDLLGLPMTNVKRDAAGILQTALQGMGNVEAQYALDKLGLNPDKAAATFYDDLYRAMGTDWEQYEGIYQDMIDQSWDKEKLKDNMTRRMAEDAGLKKASSLPIEFTPPGLDRSFDQEVMRQLEQGGNWMDALPEGTAELAQDIERLKPEDGAKSVSKLQKIQEVRDSIWGDDVKELFLSDILSEKEYGRFRDARKAGISIEKWCRLYEDISRETVRRTGKAGSPSQDDVSKVLERTSGLTEKQKNAVWDGYGWKSERPTDENVSKSDTKPEGLALPELPGFGSK